MKKLIALVALTATPAFSQQTAPETEAIGQRLMQEINISVTCQASLIKAQREIEALKIELAKLKEPKPNAK